MVSYSFVWKISEDSPPTPHQFKKNNERTERVGNTVHHLFGEFRQFQDGPQY